VEDNSPPNNRHGHRPLDLLSGAAESNGQRRETESRHRGGHQDRHQPLICTAHDELGGPCSALDLHQVFIVCELQDCVSGR